MTIDRYDVGVAIHGALRKVCDSSPTSAAYNLIHGCRGGEWELFAELFLAFVSRCSPNGCGPIDHETWWTLLKVFVDRGRLKLTDEEFDRYQGLSKNDRRFRDPLFMALFSTFKCFSDDDYRGACLWLEGLSA